MKQSNKKTAPMQDDLLEEMQRYIDALAKRWEDHPITTQCKNIYEIICSWHDLLFFKPLFENMAASLGGDDAFKKWLKQQIVTTVATRYVEDFQEWDARECFFNIDESTGDFVSLIYNGERYILTAPACMRMFRG